MTTEQWAGRRWAQRCQQPFSKLISKGVRLGDGSTYSLTETLLCVCRSKKRAPGGLEGNCERQKNKIATGRDNLIPGREDAMADCCDQVNLPNRP